jgi:hypothetical protein
MDTNTFIWSVIGALVVAGLGFGASKYIKNKKNNIRNSQIQKGDYNNAVNKSKNVHINQGSEKSAKKN